MLDYLKKDFTLKPRVTTGNPIQCAANGLYNSKRVEDGEADAEDELPDRPIEMLSENDNFLSFISSTQ